MADGTKIKAKPHKEACESLHSYMKDHEASAALQAFFPWLRTAERLRFFDAVCTLHVPWSLLLNEYLIAAFT